MIVTYLKYCYWLLLRHPLYFLPIIAGDLYRRLFGRLRISLLSYAGLRFTEHFVKKSIEIDYADVITQAEDRRLRDRDNDPQYSDRVWVCWLQGWEHPPRLVELCRKYLNIHSASMEIVLLDRSNYRNFVNIPESIVAKWENGTISHTHFSDVLRSAILYRMGGLWIDATILVTADLDSSIFHQQFFTLHKVGDPRKWTTYLMAVKPHSIMMSCVERLWAAYWIRESRLLHYFLIDIFMTIAYEHFPEAKLAVGNVKSSCGAQESSALCRALMSKGTLPKVRCLLTKHPFHKLNRRLNDDQLDVLESALKGEFEFRK